MRPRSRRHTGVTTISDESGELNLTGKWELDKDKSQSMYPHMKAMGCDEIAALASEQLNIRMNIVQKDGAITIWQRSQLGLTKRMLFIGKESMEKATEEVRKVWINVTDCEMTVDTKFKRGRILDSRILQRESDGSIALVTSLSLSMKNKPGVIRTTRYFLKTGDPDQEVVQAHEASLSTGSLAPSVTLSASAVRAAQAKAQRQAAKSEGMKVRVKETSKPPLVPATN